MKRHIIFEKNVYLTNELLNTGKCNNEGNWILVCNDSMEDMKILQSACDNITIDSPFKDYKLVFANENNYADNLTV